MVVPLGGMTLSELDNSLPNGFHDAYLTGLSVYFRTGQAELDVQLLVNGIGEAIQYREAKLRLSGLTAFVWEPPDQISVFSRPIGISSFETIVENFPGLIRFPEEVRRLVHSFYVESPWNTFLHIAAASVELVWLSDR